MMYCNQCGSQIIEGNAFCVSCGTKVKQQPADPPAAKAQNKAPAANPPAPKAQSKAHPANPPVVESRSYTCSWCGFSSEGTSLTCSACGASVDIQQIITKSGWHELPPIQDMARIQFGNSTCQIEGTYVPVADMNLAQGDSVYFTHHVLLWKDTKVNVTTLPLKGGWKRLFAGLPLIMTQAAGPGHIAFSKDAPGEVISLPLQAGHTVDVREHVFMVATDGVTYDWTNSGVWFTTRNGDERETHYPIGMFLDRFSAQGKPGLLLLHGAGNVFVRTLSRGERILIKPTSFLFKDTNVSMHLRFERPSGTYRSWRTWGERHLWLQLTGPGRVAVQSAYEHFHDPGSDLVDSSPAATHQW